ncbi:hypothetical protein ACCAA_580005 [Candidatus Accumulibacter aalborgensis]|uniref:Uncharacterized protein n=1 Tax=Candidatus Accumulibacter aalborgensis TaxID=1860102 RepID=A0A1A8XWW6_9PROT|nr:hypothetical protein ACCAA_580005 [Candidatus Accumulibacter aalborgensis]
MIGANYRNTIRQIFTRFEWSYFVNFYPMERQTPKSRIHFLINIVKLRPR